MWKCSSFARLPKIFKAEWNIESVKRASKGITIEIANLVMYIGETNTVYFTSQFPELSLSRFGIKQGQTIQRH